MQIKTSSSQNSNKRPSTNYDSNYATKNQTKGSDTLSHSAVNKPVPGKGKNK